MKLFNHTVCVGDTVYSASMGYGRVESLGNGFYVNHSGQRWRYNRDGVRSGCKISDLSWHPKPDGLQIKDCDKQTALQKVIDGLAESLGEHCA